MDCSKRCQHDVEATATHLGKRVQLPFMRAQDGLGPLVRPLHKVSDSNRRWLQGHNVS